MFLTKKNGAMTVKPKQKPKIQKALGGWGDDEEEESYQQDSRLPKQSQQDSRLPKQNNLLDDFPVSGTPLSVPDYQTGAVRQAPVQFSVKKSDKNQQQNKYFTIEELSSIPNIECEMKLVDSILQPGGIRLKPTDIQLQDFQKECKVLNISIVGSLLISKLYDDYAHFQSKTKALSAIEYLSKKNMQYSVYFKLHSDHIRNCPESSENAESYLKIKKNVLHTIGVLVLKPDERSNDDLIGDNEGFSYVDPGYNEKHIQMKAPPSNKVENKEKGVKKFISPTDMLKNKNKKILSGPNGSVSKPSKPAQFDLLGEQPIKMGQNLNNDIDLLAQNNNDIDLLAQNEPDQSDLLNMDKNEEKLTFDQLMGKQNKSNQFDFHL